MALAEGTLEAGNKSKNTGSKAGSPGPLAWVVLVCTTLNTFIATGLLASVTIYYVTYLQVFQQSNSFTAWIPATQASSWCLAGPISSAFLSRFGCRASIVFGSLMMASCYILCHFATSIAFLIVLYAGIGASQSFIQGGNLMAISGYFKDKASIYVGLMLAGAGLGSTVIGLEVEWAIETFGWRGSMLIQSAIVLQICVMGFMIFPLPSPPKTTADQMDKTIFTISAQEVIEPKKKKLENLQVVKYFQDLRFWLAVLCMMTSMSTGGVLLTILKEMVNSKGLESSYSMVLLMMGVGTTLGRASSGLISHYTKPPTHNFVICMLAAGFICLNIVSNAHWAICATTFAWSICLGQQQVCVFSTLVFIFGQTEMAIARGYVLLFCTAANLGMPPVAGLTADLTGGYDMAIILAGALCALCGLSSICITILQKRRKKSMSDVDTSGNITILDVIPVMDTTRL